MIEARGYRFKESDEMIRLISEIEYSKRTIRSLLNDRAEDRRARKLGLIKDHDNERFYRSLIRHWCGSVRFWSKELEHEITLELEDVPF